MTREITAGWAGTTKHWVLAAAVLALWPAGVALGQASPADDIERRLQQVQRETRLQASPDLAATDRALVDYGASLTASYFSTDTSTGDNRALRQYDLNLFARLNFDGAHEFYFRDRFQYRDYNPGDQTATDDDGLQNYFEEAYYRFDLARYLAAYKGKATTDNLTVTAGRQFVEWGTGLVLSQYMDAVKGQIDLGPVTMSLLAGVTQYGTTDFDLSRPHFDKSTYRGFYGGLVSYQVGQHRPFAYGLIQRDYNKDREVDIGLGQTAKFDYNSYYLGIGSTGNLTDRLQYTLEAVYEGGNALSSNPFDASGNPLPQERETIQAWAGQASLDYLFSDPRHSRLGSGFIVASGDEDRGASSSTIGGNSPGTNDNAFNALGIVSAGYAFAPQTSNLMVLRFSGSMFPLAANGGGMLSRMQVGTDLLFYGKTLDDGPIDEQTSTSDTFLGTEVDAYLNWRILEDVTLQGRYGVFFPGAAIPGDDSRQFLYMSMTYSF